MTTMASQFTSLTVVYTTVYSDADQRKHQSSTSLAFVCGSHRDRWIPRTKGQLRGKCFHLMTSSWWKCVVWRRKQPGHQQPRYHTPISFKIPNPTILPRTATLIANLWVQHGVDRTHLNRTQVGPMLAPWTLLSWNILISTGCLLKGIMSYYHR